MDLTKDEQWLIDEKYEGSSENKAAVRADLNRLALGEPVAYVIGWQPFLGLRIYLDSHPLIPRPETEWWTEELAQSIGDRSVKVLDLCAGSGAIGCALVKGCPNAHVSFGELVPEHAATIIKNINKNDLDATRTEVRSGDLFVPFAHESFDVIAANPPYIPTTRELERSVERFEPREALRSGEDGLELIQRIAKEAPAHLNPGGQLWIECDSEHADAARALVEEHAKRTELRTDLYGRPRLVVGYY